MHALAPKRTFNHHEQRAASLKEKPRYLTDIQQQQLREEFDVPLSWFFPDYISTVEDVPMAEAWDIADACEVYAAQLDEQGKPEHANAIRNIAQRWLARMESAVKEENS